MNEEGPGRACDKWNISLARSWDADFTKKLKGI